MKAAFSCADAPKNVKKDLSWFFIAGSPKWWDFSTKQRTQRWWCARNLRNCAQNLCNAISRCATKNCTQCCIHTMHPFWLRAAKNFDCTQLSCMQPAVHTIQFDCATGIFALRNQKVAPSELSLKNGFRFTPNFKIDFGGFKLGKFYLIIGINIQILFERFEWRLCHIWLSYEGSNLVKTTSYRKMKSLKPFVEYTLLNTRKCVINELELAQFVVNNYLQIIEQEIWEE